MNTFVNPHVGTFPLYFPPLEERQNFSGIRLDFNERTLPPSKSVLKKICQCSAETIVSYPAYSNTLQKVGEYAAVSPKNIILTNGAEQAIDLIFRAFTTKGSKVIIPTPSFPLFFQYAGLLQNVIISPFYQSKDGAFPFKAVLEKITPQIKLIIICNPNNPTGTILSLVEIESIVQKAKNSMVLVDEAYFEFSGVTAVPLLKKYRNLIIVRTFSKAFGLAGLRIGYALSAKENIQALQKVKSPYNVNMLATIAARAALKDRGYMDRYVAEVMQKSKPLVEQFFQKNNVPFFPSQANFILFQPRKPRKLFQFLKTKGFLLRPQKGKYLTGKLRLTLGTSAQIKKLLRAYQTFLSFEDTFQ